MRSTCWGRCAVTIYVLTLRLVRAQTTVFFYSFFRVRWLSSAAWPLSKELWQTRVRWILYLFNELFRSYEFSIIDTIAGVRHDPSNCWPNALSQNWQDSTLIFFCLNPQGKKRWRPSCSAFTDLQIEWLIQMKVKTYIVKRLKRLRTI